jgi:hypothetical protein
MHATKKTPEEGLEPSTYRLTAGRAANCAIQEVLTTILFTVYITQHALPLNRDSQDKVIPFCSLRY